MGPCIAGQMGHGSTGAMRYMLRHDVRLSVTGRHSVKTAKHILSSSNQSNTIAHVVTYCIVSRCEGPGWNSNVVTPTKMPNTRGQENVRLSTKHLLGSE